MNKTKFNCSHTKIDYFQLFINPIKVKEALLNEEVLNKTIKDKSSPNLNFRRKLALFGQEEILNERVKLNI